MDENLEAARRDGHIADDEFTGAAKTVQAEHTPGPWHIEDLYHIGYGFVGDTFPVTTGDVHERNYKTVAYVCAEKIFVTENDVEFSQANARLIAAAPELLEALKAALPILDDTLIEIRAKAENDARFEPVARAFEQQCADARAAIKKATGQKFGGDLP
jgi:hypothetical protein